MMMPVLLALHLLSAAHPPSEPIPESDAELELGTQPDGQSGRAADVWERRRNIALVPAAASVVGAGAGVLAMVLVAAVSAAALAVPTWLVAVENARGATAPGAPPEDPRPRFVFFAFVAAPLVLVPLPIAFVSSFLLAAVPTMLLGARGLGVAPPRRTPLLEVVAFAIGVAPALLATVAFMAAAAGWLALFDFLFNFSRSTLWPLPQLDPRTTNTVVMVELVWGMASPVMGLVGLGLLALTLVALPAANIVPGVVDAFRVKPEA